MKTITIRTDWHVSNEQLIASLRAAGLRVVDVFRGSGLYCHVTLVGGNTMHVLDGQTFRVA